MQTKKGDWYAVFLGCRPYEGPYYNTGRISQRESPSALFCQQQHTNFTVDTELAFEPQSSKDLAGIVLLQNESYNFVYGITMLPHSGQTALTVTRTEKTPVVVASVEISRSQPLRLRIEGQGRYYNFLYAEAGGEWKTLAHGVDAINLSTARSDGFIGACIGLYATKANL